LLVALYHLRPNASPGEHGLIHGSFLFVDFFFVLSGFVLTQAYADAIGRPADVGIFMVRRFGRLWPLHIALLLAFVLLAHWNLTDEKLRFDIVGADHEVNPLWTNLALTQSLGVHEHLTFNYPSWSISTEFYVNLAFVLALFATPQRLPLIAACLVLVGAAVVIAFARHGMDTTFDFGFFRCLYGFFLGVLLHRLWIARPSLRLTGTIAEVLAVALAVVFVASAGRGPLSFAAPIVFAAVVWVFASEAGALSRLLKLRPLQTLGAWSYSIYMVQALVLQAFILAAGALAVALGPAWRFNTLVNRDGSGSWAIAALSVCVFLGAIIGLSALTHTLIERPFRRWFNALAEKLAERRMPALALQENPAP